MTERDLSAPHPGSGPPNHFQILATDPASRARTGVLRTRRGNVRTPAFMPVGTQATVKALTPDEVRASGTDIILANTYHLMLRPGLAVLEAAGGLQRFMAWDGPILTDSGGFQVFSLAQRREVREAGVTFRSHIDGSRWELTPESAIDLQVGFGSDIIMPLDELVGYGSDDAAQEAAMARTHRWLRRAVQRFAERTADSEPGGRPLLFGIAQGGFDLARRRESAAFLGDLPLDGSAIGGLSVGEPKEVMAEMLDASVDGLPPDRPRYLMGVGSPEDLWRGVAAGVDMFDCVHPTRVARRGALFTPDGRVDVTSPRFRTDFGPIDPTCGCPTCATFSAAYLHHLFRARELLAARLGTIHNLWFVQREMRRMREAIADGTFVDAMRAFLDRYRPADCAAAAVQRRRQAERLAAAEG